MPPPSLTAGRSEAGSPPRLLYIDALRGAACLWVVLYHAHEFGLIQPALNDPILQPVEEALFRIIGAGHLGVNVFVALSGFCLALPFARCASGCVPRVDVRRFWQRRAVRILPAYYAALLLWYVFCFTPFRRSFILPTVAWDLPAHLLLLHNLRPETVASIDPSFWSLGLEAQLYVVFPAILRILCRDGLRKTLFTALLITLVTQRFAYMVAGPGMDWRSAVVVFYGVPGMLFTFVGGMAAALLVARPRGPNQSRHALTLAALLLPGALLLAVGQTSSFGTVTDCLWAVIATCGLVGFGSVEKAITEGSRPRSLPARTLRLLAGLGTISYSVYLLHQPLLSLISGTGWPARLDAPFRNAAFALTILPAILTAALLFWWLFEHLPLRIKQPAAPLPAPVVSA